MRRVLFTGSRDWTDVAPVMAVIRTLGDEDYVLVGDASGLDSLVRQCCRARVSYRVFAADWAAHGKAAGPIRNQRMIDEGKPTEAHAFPLPGSRGTWDCVRRCEAAGVPVTVHK